MWRVYPLGKRRQFYTVAAPEAGLTVIHVPVTEVCPLLPSGPRPRLGQDSSMSQRGVVATQSRRRRSPGGALRRDKRRQASKRTATNRPQVMDSAFRRSSRQLPR
jgi:hypothetical protein